MTDERGIYIPRDIVNESLNYDDDGTPLREEPTGSLAGMLVTAVYGLALGLLVGWFCWSK